MQRILSFIGAIHLGLLAQNVSSAEVLLKELPGEGYLTEAQSILYGNDPHIWAPGFRTASTSDSLYLAGWKLVEELGDGFVSRLDPAGSIIWTRQMSEIMDGQITSGVDRWEINDIETTGTHLYVCGRVVTRLSNGIDAPVQGFVAKLTLGGSLLDYSLFDAVGLGALQPFSRATALTVGARDGVRHITVVGDAYGASMRVLQKQNSAAAATVFDNLEIYHKVNDSTTPTWDAFVISFDENLGAIWGTTLGNDEGDDFATAIAADNSGALYVGLVAHENSTSGGEYTERLFTGYGGADGRKAYYVDENGTEVRRNLGIHPKIRNADNTADTNVGVFDHNFDPHPGSVAVVYRMTPQFTGTNPAGGGWTGNEITHHFFPIKLESGEVNSHSRVTDLLYSNGSVYAVGEWRRYLMPVSTEQAAGNRFFSLEGTDGYSSDIWLTKLGEGNLLDSHWTLIRSTDDDYAASLAAGNDSSIYLAGIAGGALQFKNGADIPSSDAAGTPVFNDPTGDLASNSSSNHLFWQKFSTSNLAPVSNWHVTPVEGGEILNPTVQRVAGIGVVGNSVMLTGAWAGGDLVMGPTDTAKTLSSGSALWKGFVGFLTSSGEFLEEVEVVINSEFDSPIPHGGVTGSLESVNTVAAGVSITASVAAIVYEDSDGNIIDPEDTASVRDDAVTRRICIGYQFRNSTENGTANSVTFEAGADTELTFLWRTEHAIQIETDTDGVDGLTSLSVGDPSPEVNKHWVEAGESFVASIDGSETDAANLGTRWRSIGYIAEGVAAEAAGVSSGDWVRWPSLHERQQTPQMIVNAPGKVTWQWRKEHRIRQSVNSSVAEDSPRLFWQDASGSVVGGNRGLGDDPQYLLFAAPVTRDTLVIAFDATPPPFLRISSGNQFGNWQSQVIAVPAGTSSGDVITLRFSPMAGTWMEVVGTTALEEGTFVANSASAWELHEGADESGAGEFWVPEGVSVTLSAPASVDSGLSTLDLKGYYGGQGDVSVSESTSSADLSFVVTRPSSITWDYARAIYKETLQLGQFLTFSGVTGLDEDRIDTTSAPTAGNVSDGPTGSNLNTVQIWDKIANRLYALEPSTFTVEFPNLDAPDDPAKNIIVEVEVLPAEAPDYIHVLETPPVELDASAEDGTTFVRMPYTNSRAVLTGSQFSAREPGQSVLLFSQRAEGVSNGDLDRESLSPKVVQSVRWKDSVEASHLTTIGEAITSTLHNESEVGHNGYVLDAKAPVNAFAHDRDSREGPLFAVNEFTIPSEGLIAYFPLTEESGTIAWERVSDTAAEFKNIPTSATPPLWTSPGVELFAAGGQHFVSEKTVGNLTEDRLTISAWISAATFPDWGGIVTKGVNAASYTFTVTPARKLRFAANVDPSGIEGWGGWNIYESNTALDAGELYHVAVTYDGSQVRFYLNGQADGAHAAVIDFEEIDESLVIGADLPGGDEIFNGIIQDVRIYNRALSQQEVDHSQNFENDETVAPLAIAWYRVQDSIRWPYTVEQFVPRWPSNPDQIVFASQLGSEGLDRNGVVQEAFEGNAINPIVYHQPDKTAMGYNPNEEHALVAPSYIEPARPAVFALRKDLNKIATSQPRVLVQYEDLTDPLAPQTRMKVYSLAEEDPTVSDSRLPSFNQSYTYFYQNEAGLRLVPPHPLDVVIGASPMPSETEGLNVDGRISYYEDKNRVPWCVSGDTDDEADILSAWYYPLRPDFWHPSLSAGEAASFGELSVSRPRNVSYNTIWPSDSPVLKAGETLTFAGGEYATDNSTADPKPKGLPQAVSWQSAKLVFDEKNVSLTSGLLATDYLARVFPALTAYEFPLLLTDIPDDLQPAGGKVAVDGLHWRFTDLPASLQERIYYDFSRQVLGVRGLLNGRTLGDDDLLATPGAQTILQGNVLTDEDELIVKELSSDAKWLAAVTQVAEKSRNPEGVTVSGSLGIGLAESSLGTVVPANSLGLGLAVITNPELQKRDSIGGYVTIAENEHPDHPDSPVAMHVIRVEPEKYRGSIAVMEPSNVFDEKVTIRHTADFGGDVEDLVFEWIIREEDGRDLNPPLINLPSAGEPVPSDWAVLPDEDTYEVQLAGSGPVVIRDNLVFCRYRHKDDDDVESSWSAWAGAANSREPESDSPSASTDEAYVAQLVPGWVKRVTNAVNLFDARYNDFGNSDAPSAYTSALQQAGQRHEGAVAFNPDKDAIESVGLIELYQTVLDRAEDFTIASTSATSGVSTALLNAANRIAGLYTLLGNEAYADALDPMVGFSTTSGEFGSLSPTIHAFENQVSDLLDEELALLRGRPEVGARPAYNRLLWNFTNGPGEAAYVLNYGIGDQTNDGFIDDEDSRRLYPQGHGDAWGHYTMALKGYYDLAREPNYNWDARSEKFNIDGVVVDIDYLDERTIARVAAARARCGAEIVDLSYRQAYTENPAGQWQGYQDVDTDRAWGVLETAQRTGSAAFCDWLLANALLPAEELDASKTGIRKVDRTTVGELAEIVQQAGRIQASIDAADQGLNPAGLNPNIVPFDIDPVLTDRSHDSPATHFEQVFARASQAAGNALRTFDYANGIALQLRETEATAETLRQQALDQDLSYRNEMIEVFGTPYEGTIGAGKAYPAGYNGPDLYLWMYVDLLSAGTDISENTPDEILETTITPGLRNLAFNSNPYAASGGASVDSLLQGTVSNFFPNDINYGLDLPTGEAGAITLDLPRRAEGYALVSPDEWGSRRSPGEIQLAIQELVQADWKLRTAIDVYEDQAEDFGQLLRLFEIKSGIAGEQIRIVGEALDEQAVFTAAATASFAAAGISNLASEITDKTFDVLTDTLPKIAGLSNDVSAPARGILGTAGVGLSDVFSGAAVLAETSQYRLEVEAEEVLLEMDQDLLTEELKSELVDILFEIQGLINAEADLLYPIVDALEAMRLSSQRVAVAVQKGQALLAERTVFNQRVAASTTQQRYEDYTFRVFQSDALRKYRASFDLAARYAYLAGKAYQYELNLPDNHAANVEPLLGRLLRDRSLGQWDGDDPVIGAGGLSERLAVLRENFNVLQGQLGFNNIDNTTTVFSLRRELARVGMSSRLNSEWRTHLENWRVPDLWNYEYESNGVNYGYVFRRFCRPFAPEAAGAQPALVIPFSSTIEAGKNWFGKDLAGGDNSFSSSSFSTKIRSVGVRFDGYNNITMSETPQAYLIPVGSDQMFLPNSNLLEHRTWNVVDQRIPAPIAISQSDLASSDWLPVSGSTSGYFEDLRKFSSFRAYHDAGGWSEEEMTVNSRLVGRSVWNTQWVLIIPSASLLGDADNSSAGLDTFIHGSPLPGFDQVTAGTDLRDKVGVRDIRLLLQTYSASGN